MSRSFPVITPTDQAPDRYQPWTDRLDRIEAEGNTRLLRELRQTGPTTATLAGRDVLVACSNDYLGLASDPSPSPTLHAKGSTGSRLISGHRQAHRALEDALEALYERPALTFASGYHANLAVFSSVCQPGDIIASDARNHASIIDGLRLSRATRDIVPHAQPGSIPQGVRLIALEGLFSMDGDIPPLQAYPTEPWLAVDEAHAFGCLGPKGRGAAASLGVEPDILIGTFGKACGASGAFVVGPRALIDLLINRGRSFIYTTAPSDVSTMAALSGLQRAIAADEAREQLAANARRLRLGLGQLGWEALGDAHIIPVIAGQDALQLGQQLLERGVFAPAIRYPTVARGSERIRLTVSARHTPTEIDQILDAFGPCLEGST